MDSAPVVSRGPTLGASANTFVPDEAERFLQGHLLLTCTERSTDITAGERRSAPSLSLPCTMAPPVPPSD
ncbi:hypothetical protein AAFF_G00077090 [Aldrovandia affinis]|uniref:Uncharacterized protein n=1 Tax=Aldrovandia affinis TaxID=143900 RepID=A0AAD7RY64_9TELE|nr:hypothetical protein AAFF_G00077090 [Aldrovandia affinis]